MAAAQSSPKYLQIYRALRRDIESGRLKRGDRLPSEAALERTFEASRITVGRAVRDLQQAGLVERRPGSGSYVTAPVPSAALSFGLLIPDLGETEIFEPICQGMMASPLAREHALVWGSLSGPASAPTSVKEEWAMDLCRQYIERRVAGVFFAPLERTPAKDAVNRRIAEALDAAHIPVVLLDRTVLPYPERGHHDLVGIDNRRAGYLVTAHLLSAGSRRVGFVGLADAAATVDARESGYREALHAASASVERDLVGRFDPTDAASMERFLSRARPDAIVCANDWTAGRAMHTLRRLGRQVPSDVRIAGIDDLDYAALLPVPLTTFRQPTREIGAAALAAMLDRVGRASLPTRDILLHGELVVRESCGSRAHPQPSP